MSSLFQASLHTIRQRSKPFSIIPNHKEQSESGLGHTTCKSSDSWDIRVIAGKLHGPSLFPTKPGSQTLLPASPASPTSPTVHKIYENQKNTMKVLRGQETNLESSKGFHTGSKLDLTVRNHCDTRSTKIHDYEVRENQVKSMEIQIR